MRFFILVQRNNMFSHVMLGVKDLEASKQFYDVVLNTLGIQPGVRDGSRYFYFSPTGIFAITTPLNGEPATHGNGSTIGFAAPSPEHAESFHAAGLIAGGVTCENPPGWRPGVTRQIYMAYLRDLDGNKLCALHRPMKV